MSGDLPKNRAEGEFAVVQSLAANLVHCGITHSPHTFDSGIIEKEIAALSPPEDEII